MPVRILHLADIHLGSTPKYLLPAKQDLRAEELLQSFVTLLQQVIKTEPPIDAILICGDLFDQPLPEISLLTKVEMILKELNEKEIPIILVPGNHDNIITPSSIYRRINLPGVLPLLSPNIKEPLELTLQGTLFHFYGMAYSFLSKSPFDQFHPINNAAINIALIHGSVIGNPEWNLHGQDVPMDQSNLFKTGFDYLALGHYHEFHHYMENNKHIVYPGSLEPLDWSEESPRKIVIVEFEGKKIKVNSTPSDFQKKFYQTVKLDCAQHSFQTSDDIAEFVINKYSNEQCFMRLFLKGQINFLPNLTRIKTLCERKFFFFKVEDNTTYTDMENLKTIQEEETIRGLAVGKLIGSIKEEKDSNRESIKKEALKILMGYFSTG